MPYGNILIVEKRVFFFSPLSLPPICMCGSEEGQGSRGGGMGLTSIVFQLKDVEIGNAMLNIIYFSVLRDRGGGYRPPPVSTVVQLLEARRVTLFRQLAY